MLSTLISCQSSAEVLTTYPVKTVDEHGRGAEPEGPAGGTTLGHISTNKSFGVLDMKRDIRRNMCVNN